MVDKKLTLLWLRYHNACSDGIKFAIRNKLINMPFNVLSEVKGNHNNYISWIFSKHGTPIQKEVDDVIIISEQTPVGTVCLLRYNNDGEFIDKVYRKPTNECNSFLVDSNNNLIYERINHHECFYEYNSNNKVINEKCIHISDPNNKFIVYDYLYEYDNNNNIIHIKRTSDVHDNIEYYRKYDSIGNIIETIDSSGFVRKYDNKYYDDGQLMSIDNEFFIPYFEKS